MPPLLLPIPFGLTDEIDASSGSTSTSLRKVALTEVRSSSPVAVEARASPDDPILPPRTAARRSSWLNRLSTPPSSLRANAATSRSIAATSYGRCFLLSATATARDTRKIFSENSRASFFEEYSVQTNSSGCSQQHWPWLIVASAVTTILGPRAICSIA